MVDVSTATLVTRPSRPDLDGGMHPSMAVAFIVLLVGGIIFTGYSLCSDIQSAHVETTTWIPFLFLALALFIALGFEFVNGFHDTANTVATVIYTHSLPPVAAVIWSGCWNFLGVLLSTGLVAFGIISLLPVELILQTRWPCDLANSWARVAAGVIASSHQGLCFSVPISSRRSKSPSLIMPTRAPLWSTTGSALTSYSPSSLTASATSVSGVTVTSSRTTTSTAFLLFLPGPARPAA